MYRVLNRFPMDWCSMLEMTCTCYFFLTQLKFQKLHLFYPYHFLPFLSPKPKYVKFCISKHLKLPWISSCHQFPWDICNTVLLCKCSGFLLMITELLESKRIRGYFIIVSTENLLCFIWMTHDRYWYIIQRWRRYLLLKSV